MSFYTPVCGSITPNIGGSITAVSDKCVGSGEKVLIYLGRYLYRGVIQEKDIIGCQNGRVTYRWRDSKTGKMATRSVSGATF